MTNNITNTEIQLVRNSYDKITNEFKVTRVFTWKWTDNFVKKLEKNSKLLDIGCGTGRNTNYTNVNVTGIDISEEQIKQCIKYNSSNQNSNNYIVADMCYLPFQDNSFDNIISIASFHHLSNEERRKQALSEMHRVLKKNGRVQLSVWSKIQPDKTRRKFQKYGDIVVKWREVPRYYYIFNIPELIDLLKLHFVIISHIWNSGNEIFELEKIF